MNESTLVPREEMSDLDWMARNVHKWPEESLSCNVEIGKARHGTICTPAEEKEWFATKATGGQINCHCTTVDILVNRKTGKPMNTKLRDILLKQKSEWTPEKV